MLQPTLITGSQGAGKTHKAIELLISKNYIITKLDHLLLDDLEGVEAILVEELLTIDEITAIKRVLTQTYTAPHFKDIHIIATSQVLKKRHLPSELTSFFNIIELQ